MDIFTPSIYVDLDGTFIKSDMLLETCINTLKRKPYMFFLLPFWLLKGRAHLKEKLCLHAEIDVSSIPIHTKTYEFLQRQKANGSRIILATASNESIARQFVQSYAVFDDFIASSGQINLKGQEKLNAIQKQTDSFSYIGNSSEDFVIFQKAQNSYLVAPTRQAQKLYQKTSDTIEIIDEFTGKKDISVWLKQLRVHQWIKNTLIFVPIFVSNQFGDFDLLLKTLIGFFSFSLLASSTYILNDLVDLDADRVHPRKCKRPLASCQLSIFEGSVASILILILSLVVALSLSTSFLLTLAIYLVLTLTYSFKIKRYFAMDVIALASLYTIRIFAGAAIIGITVSFWLLSFSMFVFLSLALVKRCAELVSLQKNKKTRVHGRDYHVNDLNVFTSFGCTSSLLAILMYCFYMNSEILSNQYQEPQILWLALPAFGYWLMRMWVKTIRGEMDDDPIVYSLKDKGSLVSISIMIAITVLAHIL
jgi:4-hydroxybenzoate polyprenyltransferase